MAVAWSRAGYGARVDLRVGSQAEAIARAEEALGVALQPGQAVRKRRSLGLPTDRDTWARISVSPAESAAERSGLDATAALPERTHHPRWHQGMSWRAEGLLWRVDETELIDDPVICSGGVLTRDPVLADAWWPQLADALHALTSVPTARIATPHTRPITQQRIDATIHPVFPDVDTTIDEYSVAHADLSWVNLTRTGRILDWEDFGRAPRGWDAATLWTNSLAVLTVAERIANVFAADLTCRTGMICRLYACAKLIAAGDEYAGPLAQPVREAADWLLSRLGPGRR